MSDKTYSLLLIGAGIIIILVGFLLGWNIKPEKVCPVIQDTLYVKGDTILVPYPVEVIKWKEKQPAVYDSTKQEHRAYFDSSFVSHKDTVDIGIAVAFSEEEKTFEMNMDIEHKDYEILRVDTIKVNYTEIQEVEVDNPLWIWTTVIGGLLLILSIISGR